MTDLPLAWMVLQRHLPVRFLYVICRSFVLQIKYLVRVNRRWAILLRADLLIV